MRDAYVGRSVGFIIYFSASCYGNPTLSRGNLPGSSRFVSRAAHNGRRPHGVLQRGIDPQVDDPDHCHVSARSPARVESLKFLQSHSEVPERDEDWPSLSEVVRYRDRVRERVLDLYRELECGRRLLTRRLARTLVMVLEHDGFHIEVRNYRWHAGTTLTSAQTLLYMLVQKADSDGSGAMPPPGIHAPVWDELVKQWNMIPVPVRSSVELGPEILSVGRDDHEPDDYIAEEVTDVKLHNFGWDNESPCRQVGVGKFRVDFRPITVEEFYRFWTGGTNARVSNILPASWVEDGGEVKVCVVRLFRLTDGMTGRVGPHSLRPRADENRRELADDWIVRRAVCVRRIERGQDPNGARAPAVPG